MIDELFKNEVWKEIPNSKNYMISNHGRVKHLPYYKRNAWNTCFFLTKEKLLKLNNNNRDGYFRIKIYYLDGTKKLEMVHRLVANAFIPNPENLPQVNHIDGVSSNNYYTNLEWCTNLQNTQHRFQVKKSFNTKKGSSSNLSKLKEEDMFEIKRLLDLGIMIPLIAKKFNISQSTIYEFKAGRSWRQLDLFPPKAKKSEKYFNIRYVPTTQETEETL
jgi:hypothetical protein